MYSLPNEIPRYNASNSISNDCWHKVSSSCSVRHPLRDLEVKRDREHHLIDCDQLTGGMNFCIMQLTPS